jgi:hypothetical protein
LDLGSHIWVKQPMFETSTLTQLQAHYVQQLEALAITGCWCHADRCGSQSRSRLYYLLHIPSTPFHVRVRPRNRTRNPRRNRFQGCASGFFCSLPHLHLTPKSTMAESASYQGHQKPESMVRGPAMSRAWISERSSPLQADSVGSTRGDGTKCDFDCPMPRGGE